jgi:hypothetical protein
LGDVGFVLLLLRVHLVPETTITTSQNVVEEIGSHGGFGIITCCFYFFLFAVLIHV